MAARFPFFGTRVLSAGSRAARRNTRMMPLPLPAAKKKSTSQWWIVDGEMHEVGDDVPPRERFWIPRNNVPNRRRKQLRAQFMRKTRLNLKETEPEIWCKQYMELYQQLRDNWERLYWDEGFSKRIAEEHAQYDSEEEEDDDADFSPHRRWSPSQEHARAHVAGFNLNRNEGGPTFVRDALQFEREKKFRERAFAPMEPGISFGPHQSSSGREPLDPKKFFS